MTIINNNIRFASTVLFTLAALSSTQNLHRTTSVKINDKKEAEVNPDIVTVGYEKIAKTYYGRKGGSGKGGSTSYSKGKGKSSKGKGGGSKSDVFPHLPCENTLVPPNYE